MGPVNTLRTRLETSAVFKEEWVKDINKEYSENSLNRSQSMKVEKQKYAFIIKIMQKLIFSIIIKLFNSYKTDRCWPKKRRAK